MIKHKKKILVISIGLTLMIGGIVMTLGMPFDHFLTHDYTKVSKEDQIKYLKKNEKEMTKGVMGWNSKIKSVQWQWDTVNIGQIGNGTPQGGGWMLTIEGKFNGLMDSDFEIGFDIKDEKSWPNIDNFIKCNLLE